MTVQAIFGMQFILSLVVWGLIAKWLLAPWLDQMQPGDVFFWLILPHAFRHIGMVFLVPGVVAQPLPSAFANPAAYGDLLAGCLALLALIALRSRWAGALAIVWLFNIVGTLDLLNALRQPEPIPHFGAAWYIPTFFVPLLLVTHLMIYAWLIKRSRNAEAILKPMKLR